MGQASLYATVWGGLESGSARGLNNWTRRVLATAVKRAPLGPPVRTSSGQFRARDPGELHPGFLRRSGQVSDHAIPGHLSTEIEFTAWYAADQHESLSYEHKQGGQAKYLTIAVLEHTPELAEAVAVGVRNSLGQGPVDYIDALDL